MNRGRYDSKAVSVLTHAPPTPSDTRSNGTVQHAEAATAAPRAPAIVQFAFDLFIQFDRTGLVDTFIKCFENGAVGDVTSVVTHRAEIL